MDYVLVCGYFTAHSETQRYIFFNYCYTLWTGWWSYVL